MVARKPLAERINDRLQALTECLCAELTPDGADAPFLCLCQRIPGVFPGESYSEEGEDMAWVRTASIYPSQILGQAAQQPGNCSTGVGFDVEIGVMRCFSVQDDGSYDPEVLADLASRVIDDYAAMVRAITCCEGPISDPWSSKDWIVGSWQPLGPAGAMTGGTMTIYMGL